jgi:hypothetical protein
MREGHVFYVDVFRSEMGVVLCIERDILDSIQNELSVYLSATSDFIRRYPCPISMILYENYMSTIPKNMEITMRTLYKLIHSDNRNGHVQNVARHDEREFEAYAYLKGILSHFTDKKRLEDEFDVPFRTESDLLFRDIKQKNGESKSILYGIRDVSCIQRAIKSLIEMKKLHHIGQEGLNVLIRNDLSGVNDLPDSTGHMSLENTLAVYRLCSTDTLSHDEAIRLFYDVRVQGNINFSAKIGGIENWKKISPWLMHYQNKAVYMQNALSSSRGNSTYDPLFECIQIIEEKSLHPFNIDITEYRRNTTVYRGNSTRILENTNVKDFPTGDKGCPMMLHPVSPHHATLREWSKTDIFPITDSLINHTSIDSDANEFSKMLRTNPWSDMSPFEDSHPLLLEYLMS